MQGGESRSDRSRENIGSDCGLSRTARTGLQRFLNYEGGELEYVDPAHMVELAERFREAARLVRLIYGRMKRRSKYSGLPVDVGTTDRDYLHREMLRILELYGPPTPTPLGSSAHPEACGCELRGVRLGAGEFKCLR